MRSTAFALGIALSVLLPAAGARVTEECNTGRETGSLILYGDPAGLQALQQLTASPARDPDGFEHLWRPGSASMSPYASHLSLKLGYDWIEDTAQIAREIQASTVMARYGITEISVDTAVACFSPPPAPPVIVVTEYHNAMTDHYFMSSSAAENAFIDSGGTGAGWSRTGESFSTTEASACYGTLPVFRFYSAASNSHFFTASPVECGLLRNRDPGWQYEALDWGAFGVQLPAGGACAPGLRPVYRLYNNRAAQLDSNHRHVTSLALYAAMQARGWVGEGIAMCIR